MEIDSELADDIDRSAIFEQVQMGVAVRMACLKAIIDNKIKTHGLKKTTHFTTIRKHQKNIYLKMD